MTNQQILCPLEMAKKSAYLNLFPLFLITFSNGVNAMVRLDILAEVCTRTRTIFKAYVRMNDVQRTVL